MGNEVTIVTSKWVMDDKGKTVLTDSADYMNSDGVHMVRINCRNTDNPAKKVKKFEGLTEVLEKEAPDLIFLHGIQTVEVLNIIKYLKKHKNVALLADNHGDYSNSGRNFLSKHILHGIFWRYYAKKIDPYVIRYYGVMPARVDFLADRYKLDRNKIEYLPMGADDEMVKKVTDPENQKRVREKLGIKEDDFVISTGGKIDYAKTQVLNLMEAVTRLSKRNIRLIVFGSVEEGLKEKFNKLLEDDRITYVGWSDQDATYGYFSISDLVCFPGRHSVYWEQVVAMQKPMICKYWDGTTHVDIGGNVIFLKEDTVEEVYDILDKLTNSSDEYNRLADAAKSDRSKDFLYSRIALKSLEAVSAR